MTWVKQIERHYCRRPHSSHGEQGDVWMCDDCGKFWVITAFGWGKLYNPLRIWWLKRASK
ncbi:hypothetical protein ACFYU5_18805 [Nocardia aobensis]|uniref:Uncharacterized protein n=1 Tax=Nocardia aobensis TaxID=257277 RepID=A0ABW6P5N5_9NOCA